MQKPLPPSALDLLISLRRRRRGGHIWAGMVRQINNRSTVKSTFPRFSRRCCESDGAFQMSVVPLLSLATLRPLDVSSSHRSGSVAKQWMLTNRGRSIVSRVIWLLVCFFFAR